MTRYEQLSKERQGEIALAILTRLITYPEVDLKQFLIAERGNIMADAGCDEIEFAAFLRLHMKELILRHEVSRTSNFAQGLPSAFPVQP